MTDLSKDPVRLRNITATEMATLFGLNKYSSPAKLLENKLNPQPVVNNHVRRGKLMEPAVLEAFLLDMKIPTYRHEGGTLELPLYRIAATPDAYTHVGDLVVEAKSIMSHTFDKWYDEVPYHYHVQVLVQMFVLGIDRGYIGALEAGDPKDCEHRFVAWVIKSNEEIEELMVTEVQRFWKHVEEGKQFRVDSKVKKRVLELLPTLRTLAYPSAEVVEAMKKKEEDEDLSYAISLFQ